MIAFDILDTGETWDVEIYAPVLPRVGDELDLYLAHDNVMRDTTRWRVTCVWHGLLVPVGGERRRQRRVLTSPPIYVEHVPDDEHTECDFEEVIPAHDGTVLPPARVTICVRCGRLEP